MGEVFLAEDTRLHRLVALKALQARTGEGASRRLLHEAQVAARLNHPGIAAVHDVIEEDGRPFIVMEYVEGRPLNAVAAEGPLPVEKAIDIGIALAEAVAFAHSRGVVHRDIKPANVVLTPAGSVKLLDLGVARIVERTVSRAGPGDLTSTGMPFAGTLPYIAPEVLAGGSADAASDVYSLGVLLFEVLASRRPFEDRDAVALAMAIGSGTPPRLDTLRPEVPQSLAALVARTLERDPARRLSAAALGAELASIRRALQGATTVGGGPRPLPGTRSRRWILLAASSLAVLGLVGWLYSTINQEQPLRGPIAVLPAVNLSAEPELDAIGAGLMSIIAANLDDAPGLTVVPQSAATGYRGGDRDIGKAAAELGAPYLIDVRLHRTGGAISADVRLLRAGADEPLWSQTVEGPLLRLQQGLLGGLATALERARLFSGPLTDADRERLRKVPTQNANAMQAYARGQLLLDARDSRESTTEAIAAFTEAIGLDERFALAHAALSDASAAMYRHLRDPAWLDRASASARRAAELEPRSGHVQYALANIYRATGKPADALRHLELALRRSPDNEAAHRLHGLLLRDQGKYEDAARALEQAIALRPGYWLNNHQLGLIWFRAGEYGKAIPAFTRVTELRPEYPGGYQALGTAHHYVGNIDQAIGYYGHAVRLGPSAEAYANLGYTYYVAGRLDEALAMYEKAAELAPESASGQRNLGDVLMRLGRRTDAQAAYERAIDLANKELRVNARNPPLIGVVALSEARLGRIDAALRHSAEALVLAPDDSDAHYNHAAVNALAKRVDAAIEHLARALELGYPKQLAREDDYFSGIRSDNRYDRLIRDTTH
jgi:serine/threonine-protein kinase